MVEAEMRIVRDEDHLFTYELHLYGLGYMVYHVTSFDCMIAERSCDSLAKEELIKYASIYGLLEGDLKWIQNN